MNMLGNLYTSLKGICLVAPSENVKDKNLSGEAPISSEHQKSNKEVRGALIGAGIIPEKLPPAEDIKKVESRLKTEGKKLPKQTKKLNLGRV